MRLLLILLTIVCFSCSTSDSRSNQSSTEEQSIIDSDPLPSWNDSEVKKEIISFVKNSISEDSAGFIERENRIATFDNDGTLWSEKPLYFQLFFAIDRIKSLAKENPELYDDPLVQKLLTDDPKVLSTLTHQDILETLMKTHAGMNTEEFEKIVLKWINTSKHPRFDKPFTEVVFQPMLELIDYLHDNNFKVYIVSGGGVEFMRPWVENTYGIPKERIIGSTIKTRFGIIDGKPVLERLPEINFINDKEGKPIAIHRIIGKKPVFSAGNSDGDLQMMQWTDSNDNSFILYVHHTDGEREWEYDRKSSVGHFDKALDIAKEKEWNLVDMKNDWKVIYPFDSQ
ncbi:HAD family hydrolase [Mangrovivirga sp. M17]|uniref:phosphoserine phosphatase n=1 Tax=Mangrovivirga halotolerans TaxID=2993936 RepID=A0ABT3RQ34_9BACT|nr:HAD family hydrolase [Mangrovivirga halotolerans]MCX2743275.1 HAD family hydrolase [Mangrovivirga halotolerans]